MYLPDREQHCIFQRFFTQASNDLFSATKNRVFFRNITILVPKVGFVDQPLTRTDDVDYI